jgi:hypothetical protein
VWDAESDRVHRHQEGTRFFERFQGSNNGSTEAILDWMKLQIIMQGT